MDEAEEVKRYRIPLPAVGQEPAEFRGALSAWRGYNYQLAYTVERLTDLLTDKTMHSIRVEGCQDLDISYQGSPDGDPYSVTFIQLKDTSKKYSISSLGKILQRFLSILKDIRASHESLSGVSFKLILAHRHFDNDVSDIYNHLQSRTQKKLSCDLLKKLRRKLETTDVETTDLVERLIIEVIEDRGSDREKPLWEASRICEEDFDYLTYSTQFERNAIINLQRAGVDTLGEAQNAFNRLRRNAAEAAATRTLSRIFDKKRVESIVAIPTLKSIFDIAQGVIAIDEDYLNEQAESIQKHARVQPDVRGDDPFAAFPFLGEPADWKHIAADLDFTRDVLFQKDGLLESLNTKIGSGKSSAVIVHGEPGAGKSALVKRAAICLLKAGTVNLVYEIIDLERLLLSLTSLQRALTRAKRPSIFVMDDVFQDDPEMKRLSSLLAFSRYTDGTQFIFMGTTTNDLKPRRFPPKLGEQIGFIELKGVSAREKKEICQRFSVGEDLAEQLNTESFLVAMMEATSGRKFKDILGRMKDRLAERSLLGLFEWLCAAGRFGIEIPESLLRRLLAEEARVLDDPVSYGLEDYIRKTKRKNRVYWTVRHRKIAQEFFSLEEVRSVARTIHLSLAQEVDPGDSFERRCLVLLIRNLSIIEKDIAIQLLEDAETKVLSCKNAGSVFELYNYWPQIYTNCGKKNEADSLRISAFSATPVDSGEIEFLVSRFRQQGKWSLAVATCYKWLEGGKADSLLESTLLSLHSDQRIWAAERLWCDFDGKTKHKEAKTEDGESKIDAVEKVVVSPPSIEIAPQREVKATLATLKERLQQAIDEVRGLRAKDKVVYLEVVRSYIDNRWDHVFGTPSTSSSLLGKFLGLIGKVGRVDQREASLNAAASWLRKRYGEWRSQGQLQVREKSEALGKALAHYLQAVADWRTITFAAHLDSKICQMQSAGADYDAIAAVCKFIVEGWEKETETRRAIHLAQRYDESGLLGLASRGRLVSFVSEFGNDSAVRTQIGTELRKLAETSHPRIEEFLPLWDPLVKAVLIRGTAEEAAQLIDLGTERCLLKPVAEPLWWRAGLPLLFVIRKNYPGADPQVLALALSIVNQSESHAKWGELIETLKPGVGCPTLPAFPYDAEVAGLVIRLLSGENTLERGMLEYAMGFCQRSKAHSIAWANLAELAYNSGDYDIVRDIFKRFIKTDAGYALLGSVLTETPSWALPHNKGGQDQPALSQVLRELEREVTRLLERPNYRSWSLPYLYALRARLLETSGRQEARDEARLDSLRSRLILGFNQFHYIL